MLQIASTKSDTSMIDLLKNNRQYINVLLIGNNPIEMTSIYNQLLSNKRKTYIADVCFSLKDSLKKILNNKPDLILLDDTVAIMENMKEFIDKFRKNSKISNIPVVLMKSSNVCTALSNHVEDYLMKGSLTTEVLSNTIEKNLRLVKRIINNNK